MAMLRKKRTLNTVLAFLMAFPLLMGFTLLSPAMPAVYAEPVAAVPAGTGEWDDPYLIANESNLIWMSAILTLKRDNTYSKPLCFCKKASDYKG